MKLVRALTMAALLLVAWATAAPAAPPLAQDIAWTSCPATAELVDLRGVFEDEYVLDYRIDFGSCEVSERTYYAVVLFYPSGGFGNGSAIPTTVTGAAWIAVYLMANPAAACVVTAPTSRTACRAIVYTEDRAALGEVIPPDSPLVSGPFIIPTDPVGPRCPGCW